MTKPPQKVLELPLPERGLLALRAAVEKVIEEHAREGLPLYTLRDGKVVAIPAEEMLKGIGKKKPSFAIIQTAHRPRRHRTRHKSR